MTDDIPLPKPLEELDDDEHRLLDFTVRFDRDPAKVAVIFVGLALACAADGGHVRANDIVESLEASRVELVLEEIEATLCAAPFVHCKWQEDGDAESGPNGDSWPEFRLDEDDRVAMATMGAQRWIETQLNRTRVPPPPACASRDEIKAAVEKNPRASVEAIMDQVQGEGLTPLFVFRATVAEELLDASRALEGQLAVELEKERAKIQRYYDQARSLAAGLEEL